MLTTFSVTSLTVCSKLSYLSLIGKVGSVHWRTSTLFISSIWNCSSVTGSSRFFQLNFTITKFASGRLVTNEILRILWSDSISTELYALQFCTEFTHLLFMRIWSSWCEDPDGWVRVHRRCFGCHGKLICTGLYLYPWQTFTSLSPLLLVLSYKQWGPIPIGCNMWLSPPTLMLQSHRCYLVEMVC